MADQPNDIFDGETGKPEDRWKERSRTYQGIADAMGEQWG